MSLEAYRQSLYTAVEAAKAEFTDYALVIEYDNRHIVDTQRQTLPFLDVAVQYTDSFQGDYSNKPFHRILGFLVLVARVKEGDGTAKANELLYHFYTRLHRRKIGDVHCEMAKLVGERVVRREGWRGYGALIPIWMSDMPV